MKIKPIGFKTRTKIFKNSIKKQLNIRITSTEINDALARAYGWQHYHEMNKSNCKFLEEYNLSFDELLSLKDSIINSTIKVILNHEIKKLNNPLIKETKDLYKLNDEDFFKLEKEYPDFIPKVEKISQSLQKNNTYKIIASFLLDKKDPIFIRINKQYLKDFIPLPEYVLKTHLLISNSDEKNRINNILSMINVKLLKSGYSHWILSSKEFKHIEPKIRDLIDKNNVIIYNSKTYLDQKFHNNKHYFYIYDQNSLSGNTKLPKPEIIIDLIREKISSKLKFYNKKIISNPEVIEDKKQDFGTLYINIDLFSKLNSSTAVFFAQARSLRISCIAGTRDINVLDESVCSIVANTNVHIIDSYDYSSINKLHNGFKYTMYESDIDIYDCSYLFYRDKIFTIDKNHNIKL